MGHSAPQHTLSKMKLGITSDCVHFITPSGATATDTHIFRRQMEELSAYFESVVICCPFIDFDAALSYSEYEHKNISFLPAPNVGGNRLKDKIVLIKTIPKWIRLFKNLDKETDIVYQRFPNNLNIPGFFYFHYKKKMVFATFTGSWDKDAVASFTTRLQKFLLQYFFRGPVWVYTNEKKLKPHIYSGFSPSYSLAEWEEESLFIEKRIDGLKISNQRILRMISVGTLCSRKNHSYILNTCLLLRKHKIPFHLVIAGSGERMEEYQEFIKHHQLKGSVELKGSVHFTELRALYRAADYVVQSPISEAYGKVPIEGFFHGLIPILSSASILADHITGSGSRGFVFDLNKEDALLEVLKYVYGLMAPERKINMISEGRSFVKNLTIDAWASEYAHTLAAYYDQAIINKV